MIIELENIHAKWKVLIENTCMLLANGNEAVWIGTGFGMYGRVTNRWKTNYMEGIHVAKLNRRETETANAILTRTDLVTSPRLTLRGDLF
jgi:hypothetical protein